MRNSIIVLTGFFLYITLGVCPMQISMDMSAMENTMTMEGEMAGMGNENMPCGDCFKASGDTVLKQVNAVMPNMPVSVAATIPVIQTNIISNTYKISLNPLGADPPSHLLTIVESTVFLT